MGEYVNLHLQQSLTNHGLCSHKTHWLVQMRFAKPSPYGKFEIKGTTNAVITYNSLSNVLQ